MFGRGVASTLGVALPTSIPATSLKTLLHMYVLALGTFLVLSSYAPDGRSFSELTRDDRFSICQLSFDDYGREYALAFGTFPVLSSYAPDGRTFRELTS